MVTKEEAKERVKQLVNEFKDIPKSHLDSMPEEDIKRLFITPLLEALGWKKFDIQSESKVLRGRADYLLKIGNSGVLVIEAKKTNVQLAIDEGRQCVSYAYHSKIKFAVLTNFKNLRVYHALSNIQDIDRNLLKINNDYFRLGFEDFIEKFDLLWLLSKESFEKGEINKLLSAKDLRVNKPIDKKLLDDLLKIREWLSKELKSKKNYLDDELIDEIVQILIDRLIFMRSVEDRGLEGTGFLLGLDKDVREQAVKLQLFPYLCEKFKEFNKKYDSKLFEEGLPEKEGTFSNEILHKVIRALYFGIEDNQARYMFNEIPGDIFGSIYEQYLGTILAGTSKRVKLDDKSGKRKKMGIYYTPADIVDYIVKNTIGEYIKDKTIDEILEIKILDPACGSGSFLTRAFQEICDKMEEILRKGEKSNKWTTFNNYKDRLNVSQKTTILTNCIYGVDLDEKAVELARLNLMLKTLEEEGHETKNVKLPHLSNIKCGNSLIDDTQIAGDKAFNWQAQFPDVFKQGGFDVVIGNPPYVKEDINRKIFEDVKKGSKLQKYYQGKMDFWYFFSCLSIDLLKDNGLQSFIAQNNWITSYGAIKLRNKILNETQIIQFLDFNDYKVFQDAGIQTMIYKLKKKKLDREYYVDYIKVKSNINEFKLNVSLINTEIDNEHLIRHKVLINPKNLLNKSISFINDKSENILSKILIKSNYKLNKSDIGNGIDVLQDFVNEKHLEKLNTNNITKGEGIFCLNKEELNKLRINSNELGIVKPYYTTEKIHKYYGNPDNDFWIIYADLYVRKNIKDFPNIKNHLDKFKKIMTSDFKPYGLHRPREKIFFEGEKILSLRKTSKVSFTYTNFPCYVSRAFLIIKPNNINLKFLVGLLNSKLINYWLYYKGKRQGEQLQIDKEPLLELPLISPPDTDKQKIISLVNQMLSLQKEFHNPKITGTKKERLEQQIKNTDYEIDEEVYNLYGVTEEEKKIIEESLR